MDFEDQALVKLTWRTHRHKPSGKDVLVPLLHRPVGDLEHKMEGQCRLGFVTHRQLGIPAGCSQLWWLFAHEMTDKLSLDEPLVKTCREPLCDLQCSSKHWYVERSAAHEGRVLELTFQLMVQRFDAVESGRTNLREYFLTQEVARTIQTKQQKAEERAVEGPTKRPSKLTRSVAAYPGEILVRLPEIPPLTPPTQAQTPVASSTDPWMPAGRGGSGASGPQLILIPPFSPPGSEPGTAGVQMVPGAPSYSAPERRTNGSG
jgi:hypothetical protein